ncbi:hypothetical protein [Streptomyces sp. NPDC097619]|uniref:hypothetical protein n=1 Tax=Streptomyces sp. NPDC097619 TaxID=3157228 RepID=UPI0033191307
MSRPLPPAGDALPDRGRLSELLEADRTLAFQRITPAWAYFLAGVAAAVAVWLPSEGVGRALAVAAVLVPGIHLLLRAKALTETVLVYRTEDEEEAETEEDEATVGRIAGRAVVVTTAVVCVLLGLAVALLPLGWIRVALPALCTWFLVDLYRSHRKRVEARATVERAANEPWYPAYRRLVEGRRASLT